MCDGHGELDSYLIEVLLVVVYYCGVCAVCMMSIHGVQSFWVRGAPGTANDGVVLVCEELLKIHRLLDAQLYRCSSEVSVVHVKLCNCWLGAATLLGMRSDGKHCGQ